MKMQYKDSGVDINAGNDVVKRIKKHVEKTFSGMPMGFGLFGGAIDLEALKKYNHPLLIVSIDGVGTKMMIAKEMNKYNTIGADIVNHSANDIATTGAKPLFFVDYIATDNLKPKIIEEIVKGMAKACKELNVVLPAGETAEMPGVYNEGHHDVVGAIGGFAEKDKLIDGSEIKDGDLLIGITSNGLHTNGYSLARKVLFEKANYNVDDHLEELGTSVGNELLKVHKCYSNTIHQLMKRFNVNGIAHITGGGFTDNIPRMLPKGFGAEIRGGSWPVLPIFKLIMKKGYVPIEDMRRTFNMGIGLVIAVKEDDANKVIARLEELGEKGYVIGGVVKGKGVKYI
ncbi:MAG: phosphoribosylformylglycinamidine cyclo-ligase [bacterium]|nr:phosphoribosylformylglycinamidine cyclo-ligase [bacterium]